jgi:hypothetical protein
MCWNSGTVGSGRCEDGFTGRWRSWHTATHLHGCGTRPAAWECDWPCLQAAKWDPETDPVPDLLETVEDERLLEAERLLARLRDSL